MNLCQQNHLQNFHSLSAYPAFSISISKGAKKKTIPQSILRKGISISTPSLYLVPMESFKITLRNPGCCDCFCESQGKFLMKTLSPLSESFCDVLGKVYWNASWYGLYFWPGCLKSPGETIWFCNIGDCLFSLIWSGWNPEIYLSRISSW